MKPTFAFLGAFFSRLAAPAPPRLVAPPRDGDWFTAPLIGCALGITHHGAYRRIDRAIARTNGARSLYERRVFSPRGGGRGGLIRQFNVAAIARDFPQAISATELRRIEEAA